MAKEHLVEVEKMDVLSRKKAKASAKPKWTRQIKLTTEMIYALGTIKGISKHIQKRVA